MECLYDVGNSVAGTKNLGELFQIICELIPKGFQFPRSTWVSMEIIGHKFSSHDMKPAAHQTCCDIFMNGKLAGKITVFVQPNLDRYHQTAILPEEIRLLQAVAAWIGKAAENLDSPNERKR